MLYVFIIIILLIHIFQQEKQIKNLRDKIKELEKKQSTISNNETTINQNKVDIIQNNQPQTSTEEIITHKQNTSTVKKSEIKNDKKVKSNKTSEEIKNGYVLITGAILIVLAAIVFLASTWNSVPNIIKTAVLILLAGMFLKTSSIAKNKFNLPDTANTFFYISMAYIPIVIFSIPAFSLFGNYFSLTGDGINLYFSITTLLLSGIYILFGTKRKENILINIGIIAQLSTVIFSSLIFTKNLNLILMNLVIYDFILRIMNDNKKFGNHTTTISNIHKCLLITFPVIGILFFNINPVTLPLVFAFVLLTLQYLVEAKNNNNMLYTSAYLISILLTILTIFNLSYLNFSLSTIYCLLTISIVLEYFYGIFFSKLNNIKIPTILVTGVSLILVFLGCIDLEDALIKENFVLGIFTILSIISYYKEEKLSNILQYLIPFGIFATTLYTISIYDISYNFFLIVSLAIFTLGSLKDLKNKGILKRFQLFGNIGIISYVVFYIIVLCISSIFNKTDVTITELVLFALTLIAYAFAYLQNQGKIHYKIFAYITLEILLNIACIKLEFENTFVTFITSLCILFIETIINKKSQKIIDIFVSIVLVLTFLSLYSTYSTLGIILQVITFLEFVYYINNKKINSNLIAFPLVCILPTLYSTDLLAFDNIWTMLPFSLIMIFTLSVLSLKKDNLNIYTLFSLINIVLFISSYEVNRYLGIMFILVWSGLHMFYKENGKDLFKFSSYLSLLLLYNNLISDLNLDEFTAIRLLGYIAFVFTLSRTILYKYLSDSFKAIEYIASFILYIYAISNYADQIDGMIFVLLLVAISIISYIKKYGPIFLSSIIAILVNVFLLTREFWFSIPWWIYLLVVGSILIGFAINNEAKENKSHKLRNKFDKFKDNMKL